MEHLGSATLKRLISSCRMLRSELLHDFLRSSINMATGFKGLSGSQCLFASVIPWLSKSFNKH